MVDKSKKSDNSGFDYSPKGRRLNDYASQVLDRINLAVDSESALKNLSSWIETYINLTEDTNMSFVDHEMQIDIVNDTNSRQVVRKCSQVGLTTLFKVKALAVTLISKSKSYIYVGPTRDWTRTFTKTELKPTIKQSPILNSAMSKEANSTDVLGIGSSFLRLGGTTGETGGAISTPAEGVYIDELDFCNLANVGLYESRLKHASSDEYNRKGTVIKFCTSTLPDYGIDKEFQDSDQKYYDVNCSKCGTWVTPDYFRDLILPGYNCKEANKLQLLAGRSINTIKDLTPEVVTEAMRPGSATNVNGAFLRCNGCHTAKLLSRENRSEEQELEDACGITDVLSRTLNKSEDESSDDSARMGWSFDCVDLWEDLIDPTKRKWIAKNPGHIVSGRHVSPWDVPKVNNIPSILMSMPSYKDKLANYYNMTLGLPFADASNSFLLSGYSAGGFSKYIPVSELVDGTCSRTVADYTKHITDPLCLGVDVGKTSNLVIGYRSSSTRQLHVVWFERFKSSPDKLLGERICEIMWKLNIKCSVIDAAPDFSTTQHVAREFKVGVADPFKQGKPKDKRFNKFGKPIARAPSRLVMACEYVNNKLKGSMSSITTKPEENIVSAYRTGTLSEILRTHNAGNIMYPHSTGVDQFGETNTGAVDSSGVGYVDKELKEFILNMTNTKKLSKTEDDGTVIDRFTKNGADHYCHALNYLNIACEAVYEVISSNHTGLSVVVPNIATFKTQGKKPSKVNNLI